MTNLTTRYNKFCVFIYFVLAATLTLKAQTGDNNTQQGLPVYNCHPRGSQWQMSKLPEHMLLKYGRTSSGTNIENKKLVLSRSETNEWSKQEDAGGSILQYDLVPD